MSLHTRHAFACLVAVGFAGACGGKVVFEGAGGSGGGNGGAGGDGGTTSMTASHGDAGGGGAGSTGLCADFCAAKKTAGCDPVGDDCETDCELLHGYAGVCSELVAELQMCAVENGFPDAPDCAQVSPACDGASNDLTDCAYPPGDCGNGQCEEDADGTTCTKHCGDVVYTTACKGDLPSACTCARNGQTLGSCTDQISEVGWCCMAFFAASG
jgi:hypothetical protein